MFCNNTAQGKNLRTNIPTFLLAFSISVETLNLSSSMVLPEKCRKDFQSVNQSINQLDRDSFEAKPPENHLINP